MTKNDGSWRQSRVIWSVSEFQQSRIEFVIVQTAFLGGFDD